MRATIEAARRQFEALLAKLDPTSTQMLHDRDYVAQLSDCVARTYTMLNDGMCEEATVCHSCAGQRDYLRDAMETFDTLAATGKIDAATEAFYFDFVARLGEINANIGRVLQQL